MILLVSLIGRTAKTCHTVLLAIEMPLGIGLQKGQQIMCFRSVYFLLFKKSAKPVDVIEKNPVLLIN